jgi:glycosyltransferase involved in cell wall biosynthesis
VRIAVNTRFLIEGKLEGIGWFSFETMRRIVQAHPEHQFIFFFDRRPYDPFLFAPNVRARVLFPPARHPLLWTAFFEWAVPRALRRCDADMFLSLDGYGSLRTDVPQHLVIHDLGFEHFEGHTPQKVLHYYRKWMPRFAKKADRIATVSQYSADDIARRYGVPADRIDVVYNGANEAFHPLMAEESSAIRMDLTGGAPYFVYVGALQPRKNVDGLFRAYTKFRERCSDPVKLVIAGRKAWQTAEIEAEFARMPRRDDVIFTGHLQPDRLIGVLGAARALAFPSHFEGFGIPVLEAIYAGIPVLTSNRSSLPEVAGDAALLVDPDDDEAIAEGLLRIHTDEALRARLVEAGVEQRRLFNWDRSAERLWESMMKTAEERGLV